MISFNILVFSDYTVAMW